MKIKILSDSTCDLSPEQLAEHDIGLGRLTVVKNGEAFIDGETIIPRRYFCPCSRWWRPLLHHRL